MRNIRVALSLIMFASPIFSTLIVIVQTDQGIAVCADKRVYNKVSGAQDTETKLFRVAPNAGFAFTGSRELLNSFNLKPMFSVTDTLLSFSKSEPFKDTKNYWSKLESVVGAAYDNYLRHAGMPWTDIKLSNDGLMFTASFVYVAANGQPTVMLLNGTKTPFGPITASAVPYNLESPRVDGQTETMVAILTSKDSRFDDLRTNPVFKNVWRLTGTSPPVLEDAVAFSKLMIQATSQRHHLVASEPALVSENYDCALVGKNGFSWLKQNAK